jgi:hypothetical protein
VLREFKNNKFPILVATDVAGKIIYIWLWNNYLLLYN